MFAGLPGLGLGGLFFIFSALLAPLVELRRTLGGRSSFAAWRVVARQFAQAVVMIAMIDLTIRALYAGLSAADLGEAPPVDAGTVLPLTLIGITFGLLVAVIGAAKLADLAVRMRAAEAPRAAQALSLPTPLRSLTVSGAVMLVWLGLLTTDTSEPSPVVSPRGDRATGLRAEEARESPSIPTVGSARRSAEDFSRMGRGPPRPALRRLPTPSRRQALSRGGGIPPGGWPDVNVRASAFCDDRLSSQAG